MGDTTRTLRVGDIAPDFELKSTGDSSFALSSYKGRTNVVLAFYPAAFSPVCSREMPLAQEAKGQFDETDTVIAGISVDNVWTLEEFARQMKVDFPLLSDFYPHGAVAGQYGLLLDSGVSERAVIGINKEGIIKHIEVVPILELPDLGSCLGTFRP